LRWARLMMGLRPSPYCSIKGFQVALECVMGDPTNPDNVFHWTDVILNLPGQLNYDPTRPRVWKLNGKTGRIAASLLTYVDDLRGLGSTQQQCWDVLHQVASKLSCLGIQVAARKTRPPSSTLGPWAGAVAWSSQAGISVRSTKEKWLRAQQIFQTLRQDLQEHWGNPNSAGLLTSYLESSRGFLVHMQQVYPAMTPYLKGLHLTIDSWRENRDKDGWKLPNTPSRYPEGFWDDEMTFPESTQDRPQFVQPVPRYESDLNALHTLLGPVDPPLRFVRQGRIHTAFYGFVDASSSGLAALLPPPMGHTTLMASGDGIRTAHHPTIEN